MESNTEESIVNIVIFETENWEEKSFQEFDAEHDLTCTDEPLNTDTAEKYSGAELISTFIYSKLGREVLEKMPDLRMIATRSTGFDHIDTDYCREKDITLSNVPTYGQNTVAEHVFGLLLTISHRLDQAIDRTRRGEFNPRGLQGFDLVGKTLGIIGTGDIGRATIRIARGFEMQVIAYDVQRDEDAAKQLGFEYVDLDHLLKNSDIISLHVPSNPKTRHLLNEEAFNKMKDGVVIINTARGELIDMEAMVKAIAEKKVAAAGLDVLAEEPVIREEAEILRAVYQREHDLDSLLADHVVLRLRNVIVTPHSAFNTREAVQRILDTTVENLRGFLSGNPQNVVGRD